jgi:ubiquinone/menaquinone biosynthesis C-methylase UbiE
LGANEKTPFRAIELGPGAGTWTKLLLGRFPQTEFVLVDISKEMLERSEKTLSSTYPNAQVGYRESDVLDYVDTRGCELFFSSRVLEYIENKKAFTEKVAELLIKDGKGFVITKMPHYDRDKLLGRRSARFHTGQINPEALIGLFEEAGLEVVGAYPVTMSVPLFHSAWLNQTLGKLFAGARLNMISEFFAESYCVIVRKP